MTIDFFVEGDPPTATAQERKTNTRNIRPVFYDPENVLYAKQLLTLWMRQHRPARPLSGPVLLVVHWMYRARSHRPDTWRDTRPDTDNLQKMLKDILTRERFWRDDAQVVADFSLKSWAKVPGIHLQAVELGSRPSEMAGVIRALSLQIKAREE